MKKFDIDEETDDFLNDSSEETEEPDDKNMDDEEFDRLLEEFISENEKEEEEEKSPKDQVIVTDEFLSTLVPVHINGRRVYVPKSDKAGERNKFSQFEPIIESDNLTETTLVELSNDDEPYQMECFASLDGELQNESIALLYDCNCNKPAVMIKLDENVIESNLLNVFSFALEFIPGRYILLVTNAEVDQPKWKTLGNHTYIEFHVYNKDCPIQMPAIKSITPYFRKGNPHFTYTPLKINVAFETVPQTSVPYLAMVFNEQLMPVAADVKIGRRPTLTLSPIVAWKPGKYAVAIQIKGKAKLEYATTMTLKPNGSITCEPMNRTNARKLKALAAFNNLMTGHAYLRYPLRAADKQMLADKYVRYIEKNPIQRNSDANFYAVLSKNPLLAHRIAGHFATKMSDIDTGVTFTTVDENIQQLKNQPLGITDTEFFKCEHKNIALGKDLLSLISGEGKQIANQITNNFNKKKWTFVIYGTQREFDSICSAIPAFSRAIPMQNRINIEMGGPDAVAGYLETFIAGKNYTLTEGFLCKLYGFIPQLMEKQDISNWGTDQFERMVEEVFLLPHTSRNPNSRTLREQDFDEQAPILKANSFEECMKELESLVGLKNLKLHMTDSLVLTRFTKMRQKFGLPEKSSMPNHMLFFGNPGTGKTTVAKMVGKIYRSMGLLSKGDVIETNRAGLVGRYIGDTEANTASVINSARGNVLFIDEAYTLFAGGDDRRDFGMRVIETLLPVMSEADPDMVVIFAGYEKELMRMMDANEGLLDRFAHKFHFDDYSAEELVEIGERQLKEKAMRLTPAAKAALTRIADDKVRHKDKNFSNARWIKNFIETGIQPEMAKRVMKIEQPTKDDLCLITEEDVIKANERRVNLRANSRQQRPVGF